MGAVSKVLAVTLRLGELVCGVIVLGLLGRFLAIVGQANTYADSRIVYTVVIACIAIALSIIFLPPFTYSFMAFPVDFIMFTLFLVAFCLLEAVRKTTPPSYLECANPFSSSPVPTPVTRSGTGATGASTGADSGETLLSSTALGILAGLAAQLGNRFLPLPSFHPWHFCAA
jgi:hypothetical protein